nr:MAG TPA: hypothetical protein [Caudoviricetes sp.]
MSIQLFFKKLSNDSDSNTFDVFNLLYFLR